MKESAADGEGIPQETIGVIDELLGGMGQESQEIERKQDGGEVLLPMPKVMFEAST